MWVIPAIPSMCSAEGMNAKQSFTVPRKEAKGLWGHSLPALGDTAEECQ